MIDFEKARITMVDCQIRPNDVTSHDVLRAFGEVPREMFVTAAQKPLAYIDEDLAISTNGAGEDRYLMEPTPMARLVQLADVTKDCIVLDVGCATGYSTAVLSRLCNSVVALECDSELVERASRSLTELGYDNAVVVEGPLEKGYPSEGPYDAIFIGGSVDYVPDAFLSQLKEGAKLVCVEGQGNSAVAKLYLREGGVLSGRVAFNCAVRPLPGFARASEFVF
ncbi:protein-L-isoaspartate O-methyltransferase [Pseudahrensia aquimaris]|uniref:Protein-L-isoaspartate O-methyltransferase n=1 Tax=Pseudahrensia aquimaris TaxID=744461 RepID=A0ABW3FI49_9HYPH